MGLVLLDSAVIAAFLDREDSLHPSASARMRGLVGRERLIVSVVSYAELLTGGGLGNHVEAQVRAFFGDRIAEIIPADRHIAERAAQLRGTRRALGLADTLILATAELAGVDLVVGADARWARIPGYRCTVELLTER